ncbi:MAG: nucleotide exchange factor GrpE [Anaerolinea sp.]|nr:nucleotide exchange factor GrpE [Anaerolinea sp.]
MTQETPMTEEQRGDGTPNDGAANGAPTADEKQESVVTQAEFQAAQAKAQEYLDGWQRARAEFANYKKRVEREFKDNQQMAAGDTIKALLPILDDFERAISNVPAELGGNSWVNGVTMIQKKFNKFLEDANVTIIDPTGQPFDPNQHEAIGMDEATETVPSGHITITMQRGYLLGERVLRPALVRVAQ